MARRAREIVTELAKEWAKVRAPLTRYYRASEKIECETGERVEKNASGRGVASIDEKTAEVARTLKSLARYIDGEIKSPSRDAAIDHFEHVYLGAWRAVGRYCLRGRTYLGTRRRKVEGLLGYLRGYQSDRAVAHDLQDDVRDAAGQHPELAPLFARVLEALGAASLAEEVRRPQAAPGEQPSFELCATKPPKADEDAQAYLQCCAVSAAAVAGVKVRVHRVLGSKTGVIVSVGKRRRTFFARGDYHGHSALCDRISEFVTEGKTVTETEEEREKRMERYPEDRSVKLALAEMGQRAADVATSAIVEHERRLWRVAVDDVARIEREHLALVRREMDEGKVIAPEVAAELKIEPPMAEPAREETAESLATLADEDREEMERFGALSLEAAEKLARATEKASNKSNKGVASVVEKERALGTTATASEASKARASGLETIEFRVKGPDGPVTHWIYFRGPEKAKAIEFRKVYSELLSDSLADRRRITVERQVDVSRRLGYSDEEIRQWLLARRYRDALRARKRTEAKSATAAPEIDEKRAAVQWQAEGGEVDGRPLRWSRQRSVDGVEFVEISLAKRPDADLVTKLSASGFSIVAGEGFWRARADNPAAQGLLAKAAKTFEAVKPVGVAAAEPAAPQAATEPELPEGAVRAYQRVSNHASEKEALAALRSALQESALGPIAGRVYDAKGKYDASKPWRTQAFFAVGQDGDPRKTLLAKHREALEFSPSNLPEVQEEAEALGDDVIADFEREMGIPQETQKAEPEAKKPETKAPRTRKPKVKRDDVFDVFELSSGKSAAVAHQTDTEHFLQSYDMLHNGELAHLDAHPGVLAARKVAEERYPDARVGTVYRALHGLDNSDYFYTEERDRYEEMTQGRIIYGVKMGEFEQAYAAQKIVYQAYAVADEESIKADVPSLTKTEEKILSVLKTLKATGDLMVLSVKIADHWNERSSAVDFWANPVLVESAQAQIAVDLADAGAFNGEESDDFVAEQLVKALRSMTAPPAVTISEIPAPKEGVSETTELSQEDGDAMIADFEHEVGIPPAPAATTAPAPVTEQEAPKDPSVFVEIRVPSTVASSLALRGPGAYSPERLHITVVYVGKRSTLTPAQLRQILAVTENAASESPAMLLDVSGSLQRFDGNDVMYRPVLLNNYDGEALLALRERLVSGFALRDIKIDGTHQDYKPHVTVWKGEGSPAELPVGVVGVPATSIVLHGFSDEPREFELAGDTRKIQEIADKAKETRRNKAAVEYLALLRRVEQAFSRGPYEGRPKMTFTKKEIEKAMAGDGIKGGIGAIEKAYDLDLRMFNLYLMGVEEPGEEGFLAINEAHGSWESPQKSWSAYPARVATKFPREPEGRLIGGVSRWPVWIDDAAWEELVKPSGDRDDHYGTEVTNARDVVGKLSVAIRDAISSGRGPKGLFFCMNKTFARPGWMLGQRVETRCLDVGVVKGDTTANGPRGFVLSLRVTKKEEATKPEATKPEATKPETTKPEATAVVMAKEAYELHENPSPGKPCPVCGIGARVKAIHRYAGMGSNGEVVYVKRVKVAFGGDYDDRAINAENKEAFVSVRAFPPRSVTSPAPAPAPASTPTAAKPAASDDVFAKRVSTSHKTEIEAYREAYNTSKLPGFIGMNVKEIDGDRVSAPWRVIAYFACDASAEGCQPFTKKQMDGLEWNAKSPLPMPPSIGSIDWKEEVFSVRENNSNGEIVLELKGSGDEHIFGKQAYKIITDALKAAGFEFDRPRSTRNHPTYVAAVSNEKALAIAKAARPNFAPKVQATPAPAAEPAPEPWYTKPDAEEQFRTFLAVEADDAKGLRDDGYSVERVFRPILELPDAPENRGMFEAMRAWLLTQELKPGVRSLVEALAFSDNEETIFAKWEGQRAASRPTQAPVVVAPAPAPSLSQEDGDAMIADFEREVGIPPEPLAPVPPAPAPSTARSLAERIAQRLRDAAK